LINFVANKPSPVAERPTRNEREDMSSIYGKFAGVVGKPARPVSHCEVALGEGGSRPSKQVAFLRKQSAAAPAPRAASVQLVLGVRGEDAREGGGQRP